MTYGQRRLLFVESEIFTRQVKHLLTDGEYARLQAHLALYPASGALLQGTGGLRKLRWVGEGAGKRGGCE